MKVMGTKVIINRKKNNKGKIEIEYYSRDELERIIELSGNHRSRGGSKRMSDLLVQWGLILESL